MPSRTYNFTVEKWVSIAVIALMPNVLSAQVRGVRKMRPIDCDGYLLEWSESRAQAFPGMAGTTYDVGSTPNGLAGYIRIRQRDSICAPLNLLVTSPGSKTDSIVGRVTFTGTIRHGILNGITAAASGLHPSGENILEFVVPWGSLSWDSYGYYRIGLTIVTACDTVQNSVDITVRSPSQSRRLFSSPFTLSMVLSTLAMGAYLVVLKLTTTK